MKGGFLNDGWILKVHAKEFQFYQEGFGVSLKSLMWGKSGVKFESELEGNKIT